jgi:hypothetical protein
VVQTADGGLNTLFQPGEQFTIEKVILPAMAFLRFSLYEDPSVVLKPAVTLKHLSTKQKQAGGNNGGVGRKSTSSRMLTHFKQKAEEEWISSRANQKAECNECHAMVAWYDRQVQLDYINTNIFLFYFI